MDALAMDRVSYSKYSPPPYVLKFAFRTRSYSKEGSYLPIDAVARALKHRVDQAPRARFWVPLLCDPNRKLELHGCQPRGGFTIQGIGVGDCSMLQP